MAPRVLHLLKRLGLSPGIVPASNMMRKSVTRLISLGRFLEEAAAKIVHLQEVETALKAIERPVSNQEAVALLSSFPSDEGSCFGLAWSILHLVETAPSWPCQEARLQSANPWVKAMLERAD